MVDIARSICDYSFNVPFLLLDYQSGRATTRQVVGHSCRTIRHWEPVASRVMPTLSTSHYQPGIPGCHVSEGRGLWSVLQPSVNS